MTRNIKWIRTRLRDAETEVKQQLLINYCKFLIIFFGTPLVAAGFWKGEDIEKVEKEMYMRALKLPNDIKRDVVMGIHQTTKTFASLIQSIAKKISAR
jgi:hypothetical protein